MLLHELHELVHSTGHGSRLNREVINALSFSLVNRSASVI